MEKHQDFESIAERFVFNGSAKLDPFQLPALGHSTPPSYNRLVFTQILVGTGRAAAETGAICTFVRKARRSHTQYISAAALISDYFSTNEKDFLVDALSALEECVASCCHCREITRYLVEAIGGEFKRGNKSKPLYDIYVKSKHADGLFKAQGYSNEVTHNWLERDAIANTVTRLSYKELAEIVDDICMAAKISTFATTQSGDAENRQEAIINVLKNPDR